MASLPHLVERVRARRSLPPPDTCRAIRRAAGLSLAELADVVGVTSQAIWLWETGRRTPSNAHVESYAAALAALVELVGDVEVEDVE